MATSRKQCKSSREDTSHLLACDSEIILTLINGSTHFFRIKVRLNSKTKKFSPWGKSLQAYQLAFTITKYTSTILENLASTKLRALHRATLGCSHGCIAGGRRTRGRPEQARCALSGELTRFPLIAKSFGRELFVALKLAIEVG